MNRKHLFFLFITILIVINVFSLSSTIPTVYATTTKSWVIILGDDDIYTYSSSFYKTSAQNYMGHASVLMDSGYRFQNITIPNEATILSAYLSLCFATTAPFDVRFYGFDENSIQAFQGLAEYDALARTEANVTWALGITEVWDVWYNSTNLAPIIQEIVNRELWVSGNALGFEHVQTGDVMATSRQYTFESANQIPILYIEYEVDPLAYITFYNQSNSVFMVDGGKIENGTEIGYINSTIIELQGIINISTQFIEWDITSGNIQTNPYNFTATVNSTIWLMTDGVEGGNDDGDGETLFLFGSVNAIPMNLLYYISLTTIGLILLLKSQFLGKLLSSLLFAFQVIWISGDILLDTQINYISAYNTTTGIYQYVNTVTHINTPILSFLIILSIGLALKGAIDTFSAYNKRKD